MVCVHCWASEWLDPHVMEIEVRVIIGSGCLLGPALGIESDV